jgi:hypothetical protein
MQNGLSGAEAAVVIAVVAFLREQANELPEGSRVRACLLAIRSNLVRALDGGRLKRRRRRPARRRLHRA